MKIKLIIFISILILLFSYQESLTYAQWENLKIPIRGYMADIKVDKAGNILAGSLLSKHTLCISKDEGDSWSLLLDPNFSYEVDVAQILITDSLVFIGSYRDLVGLVATSYDELVNNLQVNYEFKNNGLVEKYDENGQVIWYQVCRRMSKIGDYIYCGTNFDGIFRSSDNGKSWEHKSDGLPIDFWVFGIASIDTCIFVTGLSNAGLDTLNSGLYYSTNEGDTWNKINIIPWTIGGNSLISHNGVLIAGSNGGIYISIDQGFTWSEKNSGIDDINISTLAISNNYLFAGTYQGNLYMSSNLSDSWQEISDTFPGRIETIAVSENYVFVGTSYPLPGYNCGIYRAKLSDIGVSVAESNIADFSLYPNPAGDFINISVGSGVDLLTSEVQILDLLGLVVSKSELTDGDNRIDISNLARGTYFIKVGDKVERFVKM